MWAYQKNSTNCSCGHCNITNFSNYLTAPISIRTKCKKLTNKTHQLCLVHLQRDLSFILQKEPCEWALGIKDLF
ncbi:MAG: hypothetical protein EAZ27_06635 [Cytophagales bacterium]|nr:MAG: hypothetical protein EAZ27_06635 [Cytophagales bacterium]